MGRIIEYTLVSADGVFSNPKLVGNLAPYRDDAYYRDGLGILSSSARDALRPQDVRDVCKTWPGRDHPWAERLNQIKKYVFSTSLHDGSWG